MARYRVTNYGATRKLPYKGICYSISKNDSIETDELEVAEGLASFQFVDMEVISETPAEKKQQPKVVTKKKKKVSKKKVVKKKIKKKSR